jgi:Cft2 family RNA processing exonuclease
VHFLGGADEIGASCVLVSTGGVKVLVDCGLRPDAEGAAALPDLEALAQEGGPDAIVVTHAHLDHSGALPVASDFFPTAPVYATVATVRLLGILLADAVKVMAIKRSEKRSVPLYSMEGVERLMNRIVPMDLDRPREVGDAGVTLYPAGHVVGAAQVVVSTNEGDVLVTGDVSGAGQRTVAGMWVPRVRPALVVCESTYGARIHADRKAEETRLVKRVVDAASEGRRVLVPSFALGRAQEVILALAREASEAGVEIWVDGLVRSVCDAFSGLESHLAPSLRRRIQKGRSPLRDGVGPVRFVRDAATRQELIERRGLVVVASSGMLTGGPSLAFARAWLDDAEALIVLTGYQDEEAPGRALEDVAAGRSRKLVLEGRELDVACSVEKVALSAHADSSELARTLHALRPQRTALVHGNGDARLALAKRLSEDSPRPVLLPGRGEVVEIAARRGPRPGRAVDEPVRPEQLDELASRLLERGGRRAWSVDEIHRMAAGLDDRDVVSERALVATADLLRVSGTFRADTLRPFLYRPSAQPAGEPVSDGPLDQTSAMERAREKLRDAQGFLRVGADVERRELTVVFELPDAQEQLADEALEEVEKSTGWGVLVSDTSRPDALEREARRAARGVFEPTARAGINADSKVVVLKGRPLDEPDDATLSDVRDAFTESTGWTLVFKRTGSSPVAVPGRREGDRLEINAAYLAIERAFDAVEHRLLKRGKKGSGAGEHIELGFVTPRVGEMHAELISGLERETGWRLTVRPHPDQFALFSLLRDILPDEWQIARGPSLFAARDAVSITLASPPSPSRVDEVKQRFHHLTGYHLEIS